MVDAAPARHEVGSPHPTGSRDRLTGGVDGFRRFGIVTTVTTLALVALGGAVRATDSGLACPDWPACYGQWIPPADVHIWLEHSHRLLAGVVGLMVGGMALWALARFRRRPSVLWPSLAAVVLVVTQAALGAVVVLQLLRAELVTAHLGMAMVVVACLLYVTVTAGMPRRSRAELAGTELLLARSAAAVAVLCLAQILVGGHVTGIAAGLEWTTFPLMDGRVVPEVTSEREAYHVAHRLLAYLLSAAVVVLWGVAARHRRLLLAVGAWQAAHRWLVRLPAIATALVAVQVALGVANLVAGTPAYTVIPHLAVASWIWAVLVLHTLLAYRYAPALPASASPSPRVAQGAAR